MAGCEVDEQLRHEQWRHFPVSLANSALEHDVYAGQLTPLWYARLVSTSSSRLPIPLPRQTPAISHSSSVLGFHPASCRAISVAATAYCANFAMRRSSLLS